MANISEKPTTSINPGQNENTLLNGQSKEALAINNISQSRAFGRDISNLGANETKSMNTLDKQENHPLNCESGINNDTIDIEIPENDIIDLSIADIPSSTRGPLYIPGELISVSLQTGKETTIPKSEVQAKRLQKVPLNLFAMENCDILEINNPQYVSVYAKEIFDGLQEDEKQFQPKFGSFTQIQTEITERMRAILVDWLAEIHMKFRLQPETLYLAVNLVDRYVERVAVTKKNLQLVGIAAMIIASKYQEIYPPDIKDFINLSDKAYKKEDILEMEGNMLCNLQFKLTIPSTLVFLERFSRIASLDKKKYLFCQYIAELALLDYNMLKYYPSIIAKGAIHLANEVFKRQGYEDTLIKNLNQDNETVKLCSGDLLQMLKKAEKSSLKVIRKKFLSFENMEVARTSVDLL